MVSLKKFLIHFLVIKVLYKIGDSVEELLTRASLLIRGAIELLDDALRMLASDNGNEDPHPDGQNPWFSPDPAPPFRGLLCAPSQKSEAAHLRRD